MSAEAPLDVAGRVAAAAAHSFNNHVAAVALQAELALAALPPGDEKLRRRLEGILGSCEAARGLTRDLLAFGGRRPLRPERVDVVAAVERRGSAAVAASERPLWVEVDPEALDAALAELHAAGWEPVAARADGDGVELRLAREGAAVGDEDRGRLFEPFASDAKDVGLGGVYGFVRQSSGTIGLAGPEVVLRFPLAG